MQSVLGSKDNRIPKTMTETATTDRFVIEVSRVGTVDHIVGLEAEPASGPSYSSRRELPGEKLCNRSTRSPASEHNCSSLAPSPIARRFASRAVFGIYWFIWEVHAYKTSQLLWLLC